MKTSARNAFRGVVEHVANGAVNCEVTLRIGPQTTLVAIITSESARTLELQPGREAVALIKSSFVILAPGDAPLKTSARNTLAGRVTRRFEGAVNDEITLELDQGCALTATITRESGDGLDLQVGHHAQALIKASHIILAVD